MTPSHVPYKGGYDQPQPPAACQICNQPKSGMVPAALIRPAIVAEIRKEKPGFTAKGYICADDLNRFRFQYVQGLLTSEKGELSALDQEVLQSLQAHDLLSSNINLEFEENLTLGEKLADKILAEKVL